MIWKVSGLWLTIKNSEKKRCVQEVSQLHNDHIVHISCHKKRLHQTQKKLYSPLSTLYNLWEYISFWHIYKKNWKNYKKTRNPQNISLHPQNISSHPQNITSHPQNISSHPQNITSHPQNISLHPQNISLHPQNITSHSRLYHTHTNSLLVHQVYTLKSIYHTPITTCSSSLYAQVTTCSSLCNCPNYLFYTTTCQTFSIPSSDCIATLIKTTKPLNGLPITSRLTSKDCHFLQLDHTIENCQILWAS